MVFRSDTFAIVLFASIFFAITIVIQAATPNICDWIQCVNGGTCLENANSTAGYKCRCPFGFTGQLCEDRLNITTCGRNPCKNNGNCTITNSRLVKCLCPKEYTGQLCEIKI